MFSKTLMLIGLVASNASARLNEEENVEVEWEGEFVEHLDLELDVEGERQLFPLLPGTKCPTGHICRVRTSNNVAGLSPLAAAMKSNYKTTLLATMDWQELSDNLDTVVRSNDYCSRRAAMTRAAGLAAGVSLASVSSPAYAAETKEVKMGSDAGLLAFVPAKSSICSGDSVKWINNKGGPHNVVFDEDAIPDGVDQEKISQTEQMGEEGESFTMKFDTKGDYSYYCEPHRGAGMQGSLIVA